MGKYKNDKRVVLTLDAGGNSLRFNAMKGEEFILDTITLPSNANNLDLCLETMVTGFKTIINLLGDVKPEAISFAFPGPADYPAGIIGGFLPNFPSFRDGVALGPYLKEVFGIPVFINNDGDLFAFGEALSGALPEVNDKLAAAGSSKRVKGFDADSAQSSVAWSFSGPRQTVLTASADGIEGLSLSTEYGYNTVLFSVPGLASGANATISNGINSASQPAA